MIIIFLLVVRCPTLYPGPHTAKLGCVTNKGYNTLGDVCYFHCDPGYFSVNGSVKRRCAANATWSGSLLECKSKDG